MLEIFVQRSREEVESAIVQFVARRSYTLSKPWYLEGVRIEAPSNTRTESGFWSAMFESPAVPRIDVETRRKRNGTRVRMVISNTPESTRLAYELHGFLLDEQSYDQRLPAVCPRCSTSIVNVTARYCGRCGLKLLADVPDPPIAVERPPISPPRTAVVIPPPPIAKRPMIESDVERSFDRVIEPPRATADAGPGVAVPPESLPTVESTDAEIDPESETLSADDETVDEIVASDSGNMAAEAEAETEAAADDIKREVMPAQRRREAAEE